MSFFTAIATVLLLGVAAGKPSDFVVMQFNAKWCEPCKEMQPAIERLSQQGWMIRNVDVDLEKSIVQRMKVTQLPTLLILKNGQEVDRITGVHTYQELAKLLPSGTQSTPLNRESISLAAESPQSRQTSALEPFPMLDVNLGNSQPDRSPAQSAIQSTIQSTTHLTAQPTTPATVISNTPVDPMSTTVRIKTEDENSISYGTGTMIDQVNGEVLVITCGHLFRDVKPTSRITVEAPVGGQLGQFAGTVIDYKCDETDIGLLSFKAGVAVPVARLLPRGTPLREGESVASFGCDGGADPTRRDSQITKLNRYLGPSNVEVAKAPVQGRSGGGLFNQAGQLIGVCYAADKELDEGLYSGPEVVYTQLERLGLTRLYSAPSSNNSATSTFVASTTSTSPQVASSNSLSGTSSNDTVFPDQIKRDPRSRSRSDMNVQPWQQTVNQTVNQNVNQTIDQAAQVARSNASAIAAASTSLATMSSITATIRDASGRERTISIPNPSPALLQMLETTPQTAQLSNASSANGTAFFSR